MMQESPIPNIKTCVFDAYGTLFDVHSALASMMNALAMLPARFQVSGAPSSLNIPADSDSFQRYIGHVGGCGSKQWFAIDF